MVLAFLYLSYATLYVCPLIGHISMRIHIKFAPGVSAYSSKVTHNRPQHQINGAIFDQCEITSDSQPLGPHVHISLGSIEKQTSK